MSIDQSIFLLFSKLILKCFFFHFVYLKSIIFALIRSEQKKKKKRIRNVRLWFECRLICAFTSINPTVVHIDGLRQEVDFRLVLLRTYTALYSRWISTLIPVTHIAKKKFHNQMLSLEHDFFVEFLIAVTKIFGFTYIFTSQDFSWLQNGQLNCVSSGWIAFRFGGGLFFAFRRPIFAVLVCFYPFFPKPCYLSNVN